MKFKSGDSVPATTLESVTGELINLPDPDRLVLTRRNLQVCTTARMREDR